MIIDLTKLNYSNKIDINALGCISLDNDNNYLIKIDVDGIMMLHDSITYDIVPYKFTVKIEETLEKNEKSLDLIAFLWHYIVLEIPLRFTLNEGNYPHSDNFRIISEEEYSKKNNPFNDFRIE